MTTTRERALEAARAAMSPQDPYGPEPFADAASDVWEADTATARLRKHGIDLERLRVVLGSREDWGKLVYAYEVLSVLDAVVAEMEAMG